MPESVTLARSMLAYGVAESVCLVVTPSPFLLDERVFMSLGILKVASTLERAGVAVEMVDLSGVRNSTDAIRHHASATRARAFGITATTPQLPAAVQICRAIRDARPDARVILGGPHVTLVNAAAKRELSQGASGRATKALQNLKDHFDVLVSGDGEMAVFVALGASPPPVIDADDPDTDLFLKDSDLANLPYPARHLVDVESYQYSIDGTRALSLIAQLGCPFSCGFCGGRESPSLRRVRMRSTQSVVEELLHLHEAYGVSGFMLYDDELNVNPQMVPLMRHISQAQESIGKEFRLRGFIKAELFTDEQAKAMREAGFRWILTGFESGSPRILENINKKATREQNSRCVEIARRNGLKVKALMSVGHPGESRSTIMDTFEWLRAARPDDFDVTIITTYPGTPYYDRAVPHPTQKGIWTYTYPKTGDRLHSVDVDYTEVADYYKGDPEGGYQAYVFTDELAADDLVKLRDFVEHEIRSELQIPFNPSAPGILYEHSMGQRGQALPSNLLRSTQDDPSPWP